MSLSDEEGTVTVGKLARAVTEATGFKCTPRMIRNYESRGLIATPPRSSGGIRLYPRVYVQRISQIKRLQQDHHLSLDAIRNILDQNPDALRHGTSLLLSPVPEGRNRSAEVGGQRSTRLSLILAAESVLRARGYRSTTVDEVVREAGVAKGTFYLYFESKEQLFLEVLERAVGSLEEHLEDALEGVSGPIDRLERRALSYMRGYLKYRDLIHILYGEAVGGNLRFQKEFREIYEKLTSTLAEDIREASDEFGSLALDVELLSYALVGAGEMLAYRSTLDDRYDLESIVAKAIGILKESARPAALKAATESR